MKKTKVLLLTMMIMTAFTVTGCGKKDATSDSTAVEVTPTPTTTPSVTPSVSATQTPAVSGETTAPSTELTGTIISASMNDLVIRTSDNKEYSCSTLNATKDLKNGVTIGATVTVTLDSTTSENGLFKASKISDSASSSGGNTYTSDSEDSDDDSSYDSSSDDDYDYDSSSDDDSSYDSSSDDDSSYDSSSDDDSSYDSSDY